MSWVSLEKRGSGVRTVQNMIREVRSGWLNLAIVDPNRSANELANNIPDN
jgi:hypothetical protein